MTIKPCGKNHKANILCPKCQKAEIKRLRHLVIAKDAALTHLTKEIKRLYEKYWRAFPSEDMDNLLCELKRLMPNPEGE